NSEGQNPKSFEEPQSSPQHSAKNPSPPKNIAGARDAFVVASLSGGDFLRVHSVDSEQPLDPESIFSENDEDSSPKFRERRGVLHLFRSSSHSSIPSPSSRSSLVFILTVPNHISFDDLIRWCGPHLHHLHRLLFIRVGIGEIKKMAFPGANESMSGALYLQKGEDIQSERHSFG
ncbi:hypothetical protein HN51_022016, partial [Arachis hypogaea]